MALSPSSNPAPGRRAASRHTPGRPRQLTQEQLSRLDGNRAAAARLQWRNALVRQNLGLVHLVANRESLRSGRPYDDLCSAGYEGLIRAVESFDTSRNAALSSFAVPCIQGAMRMDQRERQQPLRTPRRLRELQQRARGLQEKRRAAGLTPLPAAGLAAALGCSLERLQEAEAVRRALGVASLDQPLGGSEDNAGECWLDQISAADPASADDHDPQLRWLHQQMDRLAPGDRELLEARWIDGLNWSEVAARLGWTTLDCRRRAEALRRSLQAASSQRQPSRARAAAKAV
jgi:RNA polymerase sigma-B factor